MLTSLPESAKMSNFSQIVNRFSMYTLLQDRQYGRGVILVHQQNRILKSLMEHLLDSAPDRDEEYWAKNFLKTLIEASQIYYILTAAKVNDSTLFDYTIYLILAQECLFSFLQAVCLGAAQQVSKHLKKSPNLNLHYPLEECFAIATEVALKPAKILNNFQFDSNFSLQAYAQKALIRIIKNQIVNNLKSQSIKFSDNGLLRNTSKTQLEKALLEYGFSQSKILTHCLAWQTFKELFEEFYPPANSEGQRNYRAPTTPLNDGQLSQLANRYNQQLKRLKIVSSDVDDRGIGRMLTICTQAVRNSQNKRLVSLEEFGDFSDITANSLETLIEAEKQAELTEVKKLIIHKFEELDRMERACLLLWLGLNIKQSDFLSILNFQKQFQVSREFKRALEKLLKALSKAYLSDFSERQLTELEVNKLCEANSEQMKEYLTFYSQNLFGGLLKKIIIYDTSPREKNMLNQSLGQIRMQKSERRIFDNKANIENEVKEILVKIQNSFVKVIEKQLKIELCKLSSAENRLENFIKEWLEDNQAILF